MREILFRGKRVDNGEWVEGFYHYSTWYLNGEATGISYYIRPINSGDAYEVIPETVGQFIGLNDAAGTKIFEGDVIREPGRPDYLLIIFDESSFKYIIHTWSPGWNVPIDDVESNCLPYKCYIEGNIHDDPEFAEMFKEFGED